MNTIKRNSLSANMVYQFLYQIVVFVIPLIMAPYLTRKLQGNALGIHSYIHSIAYYFLIFANLGIVKYGQRLVSTHSDSEIELRKAFWSLFVVHIGFSLLSLASYLIYVTAFVNENRSLFYIEGIYVVSALFDITWLYYGLENFRSVVSRNFIVKLLECSLVFLLVKSPDDLSLFTIISVGSILFGQMIMLPNAISSIRPIKVEFKECVEHIRPLFVLSISVIAITLYTVFDKTLLGIMSTKENVAFYEYSNRIINIPRTIIGIIGTIMYPRACKMAAVGNVEAQRKYMDYSFLFTTIIGIGSIFGLISISHSFAILYYGKSFSICGNIIIALSPLIIIVGLGDIIRTQYMIPNHMDKQYTICIALNATVNLLLTMIFIPVFGVYGAVIGTVSAELFGLVFQTILCRKVLDIGHILRRTIYFLFVGIVMHVVIVLLNRILIDDYVGLIIKIFIGVLVYCLGCIPYIHAYHNDIYEIFKKKAVHFLRK